MKKGLLKLIVWSLVLFSMLIVAVEGTDINSCTTLNASGAYTLTQNVSSTGTCFTVTANNVILNGGGYTITYATAGTANTYGFYVNGYNFTTIRNATIVEGNSASNYKYPIFFYTSSNGTILGNTISSSGTTSYGIYLFSNSNFNNVSSNTITITGTGAYGILLDSSSNSNNLVNNIITTVSGYGIYLLATSNSNTITTNVINTSGANGHGVALSSSSNSNTFTLNNVTTTGNAAAGIFLTTTSDFNVFNSNTINTTHSNQSYGISISSANGSVFRNNTITTNGVESIYDITSGSTNDLIYTNSLGEINWSKTNLTTNISLGLETNPFVQSNLLGLVDSANTLNLNSSATLTFYGLTGWGSNNPTILKNGATCSSPNCNVTSWSSGAGTLVASVASFSNYSAQDGGGAVPEFSDYAIILILVVTIGGFLVMKRKG